MKEFITGVGRLVQGSVLVPNTTDSKGNRLKVKTGPNAGQDTQNHFIAVAFQKTQQVWWAENAGTLANGQQNTFWQDIYNEARTGYPQHFDAQGNCTYPRMAFKVMDGDGRDNDGNPNWEKEGFKGHWVVKFSSTFAPKVWMNGAYTTLEDAIKRGHFVRIIGSMKPNIGSDVAGVYLNHNGVEFIAYGQEIVSGPNVGAMFQAAGAPVNLPPGATLAPPTPAISSMPAMPAPGGAPGMPAPMAAPVMAAPQPAPVIAQPAGIPPMPASMPAPTIPAGVQPNHQFVQNVIGQPAMPQAPVAMAVPAAPAFRMMPPAGNFTREQYHANGWTDDQLIAQGYMVRA